MKERLLKRARHLRRKRGIRKKILGTAERPRMAVFRSHRNITVQIIDDLSGRTLCAVSSLSKELRSQLNYGGNAEAAKVVGKAIAEKARALGIEQVRFDRAGYKYHGRIKALAEAAREGGLKF